MTRRTAGRRQEVRHTVATLFEPGLSGSLNELCNQILEVSSIVARMRRGNAKDPRVTAALASIDSALDRSVALTRGLNERLNARGAAGGFVSMSAVAREVVGHLQGSLPDDVSVRVVTTERPVLAAAEYTEVRWILAALIGYAVEWMPPESELVVEVNESPGNPASGAQSSVGVEVRCSAIIDPDDSELDALVRPAVNAIGGLLEISTATSGTTTLIVRLPSAC